MNFSKTAQALSRSGTFQFFALMKQRFAEGHDVIPLVAGELSEPTPEAIAEAGKAAIDNDQTKYTVNQGLPELREAICQKLRTENQLPYEPDQILVSNGAKHALFNCLYSLCGPGDEVLIIAPYYPSYPSIVTMSGAKPVIVDSTPNNCMPAYDYLRAAVTPRTKAIIINSPNNPSGLVYNRETLSVIGKLARDYNLWVISDDIYEKICFPPERFTSILEVAPDLLERTILINGFSKSYAMTGWRLGYAAGPIKLIDRAEVIQSHTTSNACSISQIAAVAALKTGGKFVQSILPELKKKRDTALSLLGQLDMVKLIEPNGAFYLFVNITKTLGRSVDGQQMKTAEDIAGYLLFDHDVAVVPGSAFGAPSYLRISYSTSQSQLETGLERIVTGLSRMT